MPHYNDFDRCPEFHKLHQTPFADLHRVLTPDRIREYEMAAGGGLFFNYACSPIDDALLKQLQSLIRSQELIEKYTDLLSGERMNTGENRQVLHHLTRGECAGPVVCDGTDCGRFYREQLTRFTDFADSVHAGRIKGSTGKAFTHVVQIGIGGSDLGPRSLYLALHGWAAAHRCEAMKADFISNVDPDDANAVLDRIDYETTLFILVSKSGTTQETLTNQAFVIEKMKAAAVPGLNPAGHMIAVTSQSSPLADSNDYLERFFIDDAIGGRYSSCSAVGGAVLSLAFGSEVFRALLAGAHEADLNALQPDIRQNAALMDALIGVYERLQGLGTTVVLPYCQALSRFPAHLQQMDMESNGKSVNRFGQSVDYETGPVLFGEPGTNGQHSFYQLLHQGTDCIPLQFIGFKTNQRQFDLTINGSSSQTKLNANLCAQMIAFALGQSDPNPNKNFEGNRYSTLLFADALTPQVLGALLAHYENKVMFQGFVWNLDSFDQEGVQLGKKLTQTVLSGNMRPELSLFAQKLGLPVR